MSFWMEEIMHKWKGKRAIVGATNLTGAKIHEEDSCRNICKNILGAVFERV